MLHAGNYSIWEGMAGRLQLKWRDGIQERLAPTSADNPELKRVLSSAYHTSELGPKTIESSCEWTWTKTREVQLSQQEQATESFEGMHLHGWTSRDAGNALKVKHVVKPYLFCTSAAFSLSARLH